MHHGSLARGVWQVEAFLMLGIATSHSDGLVMEHFPTARELTAAGADGFVLTQQ